MIRAFIAVELPDSIRQEVAALQAELRQAEANVKWVKPAHLHLTLKFLGGIEESKIGPLTETLKSSVRSFPPFTFTLEGIGAFPRIESPRVLWVGASEGKGELEGLARAVEEGCRAQGFPREERPFRSHLTIGRSRSAQGLAGLVEKLQAARFQSTMLAPVGRILLFQSLLFPAGPTHTPLSEIPLAG